MKPTIQELFDSNFNFSFKLATYNNMKIAIQVLEQFKKENEDFFSFDKKETLFGHLRTYVIEKQFNNFAFNSKANYSVFMKQVNKYKHKVLCIETNDFVVNIGCTNNEYKLLSPSSYKKEYAKKNDGINQIMLDQLTINCPNSILEKQYAQITYGYRYGEITHLHIVFPSSDYKKIEYSINLLQNIKIYENYIPEDLVEESIVSLKKELSKEFKKKI